MSHNADQAPYQPFIDLHLTHNPTPALTCIIQEFPKGPLHRLGPLPLANSAPALAASLVHLFPRMFGLRVPVEDYPPTVGEVALAKQREIDLLVAIHARNRQQGRNRFGQLYPIRPGVE